MRFLRSLKCSKTTVELAFTAQKANGSIPWTAWLEMSLLGKFSQTENYQLKLKFGN